MEGIAGIIISVKLLLFRLTGDFSSEAVSKFISEILTIGIGASIPIEVTIIQILGIFGFILIIIDQLLG